MRFALLFVVIAGCGSVKEKPAADAGTDTGSESVCTPNADSCGSDNAVYQCDSEGAQQTKVQDCQYGCTTDHCNQCEANTTFCSGDNVVQCDAGGSISNPMTCQFGCQNNACNVCMPNVAYCSGSTAITCGADGQPGQMQACGAAGCQGGVCNTCTPNTTTCNGDTLVVCNSGGTIASTTSCALGCSTSGTSHCKALVPSFGVPAPSGSLPNLTLTDNATLDISGCATLNVLLTVGTATNAVPAGQIATVAQTNGPPICVVKYGTIAINDPYTLTVTNNSTTGNVLSLEATGNFDITGKIIFNNAAPGRSPGDDAPVLGTNTNGKNIAPGAGGGGAARAGGNGGACIGCKSDGTDADGNAGGAAIASFATVLSGGSKGGSVVDSSGVAMAVGGLGGGGMQLVSLTRVTLASSAAVELNGGAGTGPGLTGCQLCAGAGGSGGQLVVEAPTVNISQGAIATANGGGGAAGDYYTQFSGGTLHYLHYNGQPGQPSTARAAGGDIPNVSTGDGGYEADGTASPSANGQPSDTGAATYGGGGGGGSSGWIVLKARAAANVMVAAGAVISPIPTAGAVTAQ